MAKTGGPASYVELLSCLEIMRDAHNIQNGDPLENDPAHQHAPQSQVSAAPGGTHSQPPPLTLRGGVAKRITVHGAS